MGFGIINFLFAIPAFYTIDTFGRRNLLLCTFPFMAVFQLLTGLGFLLDGRAQLAMVMTGMCRPPNLEIFVPIFGAYFDRRSFQRCVQSWRRACSICKTWIP